jgi:rabenosyn-5
MNISFQNLTLNKEGTFFVSDNNNSGGDGELVTRDHWQRETGHDKCFIVGCNKVVGKSGAGKQHCRK